MIKKLIPEHVKILIREFIDNQYERHKWVIDHLIKLKRGKILDAGCGSQIYKLHCKHLEYYSQDFGKATDGIGSQKKTYNYGKLDYVGNIWEIEVENEYFDYILCTEVFEHIQYPNETIKEFNRILQIGGKLILTVPSNSLRHMDPHYYYTGFSDNYLKSMLNKYGFKIEQIYTQGNYYKFILLELIRVLRSNVLSIILLLPGIVYLFIKNKLSNDEDKKLLCFGYFVYASKI